jgi:hypothetical protein
VSEVEPLPAVPPEFIPAPDELSFPAVPASPLVAPAALLGFPPLAPPVGAPDTATLPPLFCWLGVASLDEHAHSATPTTPTAIPRPIAAHRNAITPKCTSAVRTGAPRCKTMISPKCTTPGPDANDLHVRAWRRHAPTQRRLGAPRRRTPPQRAPARPRSPLVFLYGHGVAMPLHNDAARISGRATASRRFARGHQKYQRMSISTRGQPNTISTLCAPLASI